MNTKDQILEEFREKFENTRVLYTFFPIDEVKDFLFSTIQRIEQERDREWRERIEKAEKVSNSFVFGELISREDLLNES